MRTLLVNGNNLYAGGAFRAAGDIGATNVARWDGERWWPLGAGVDITGSLYAFSIFDTGVISGGFFSTAGGQTARSLAKWDGTQWSPIGTGVLYGNGAGAVTAIARNGGELFVGGVFQTAGGKPSTNIALWHIPHTLNVERVGNQLRLSWPATGTNFLLEACGQLVGTNWTEVPQSAVLVDDELVVTNELDGHSRFYRLRKK